MVAQISGLSIVMLEPRGRLNDFVYTIKLGVKMIIYVQFSVKDIHYCI